MGSFAVFKRSIIEEGEPDARSVVHADLKISSNQALEAAIVTIQEELSARREPDSDLVALQLQVIAGL